MFLAAYVLMKDKENGIKSLPCVRSLAIDASFLMTLFDGDGFFWNYTGFTDDLDILANLYFVVGGDIQFVNNGLVSSIVDGDRRFEEFLESFEHKSIRWSLANVWCKTKRWSQDSDKVRPIPVQLLSRRAGVSQPLAYPASYIQQFLGRPRSWT